MGRDGTDRRARSAGTRTAACRSRRRSSSWRAVPLLALAAPAVAQEPLVTDRPDFTESAVTVAPGRVQLEAGYTFAREGAVRQHTVGEVLLRIGALPFAELRLGVPSWVVLEGPGQSVSGLDDSFVGAKVALAGGRAGGAVPEVAVLAGTSLPTGAERIAGDAAEPEVTLALAWSAGERLGVGVNLNHAWREGSSGDFGEASWSGALGLGATDRLGLFAEYFGFRPESGFGGDTHFLNGGLTWALGPDAQLDGRIGSRLGDFGNDWFAGIGVSRRW